MIYLNKNQEKYYKKNIIYLCAIYFYLKFFNDFLKKKSTQNLKTNFTRLICNTV